MRHGPVGVRHGPVGVRHGPVGVRHGPVGVRHGPVDKAPGCCKVALGSNLRPSTPKMGSSKVDEEPTVYTLPQPRKDAGLRCRSCGMLKR